MSPETMPENARPKVNGEDVSEPDAFEPDPDAGPPTAMARVRLARHADRPYTLDYIERVFDDFFEMHGDRKFADDPALICGVARFRGEPVVVIGHQKGRTTRERQHRNFGMPMPEGYRKALRVMQFAEKFVGLFVKNKTLSTVLLVICVIPFWTSFLIRVLAWRPMLGKEGAINILLQKAGIISQPIEALLFTELSVIIGMTQIYVVFMVGPIAFMLGRIDPNIIEAARDLGAGFWRIFAKIIFPLSLPGVVVGAIFVSVMVLGEFATSAALSGRKVNLLGNIIVTQVGSLKWALASVVGVILTLVMGLVIAGFLRIVDLKREL